MNKYLIEAREKLIHISIFILIIFTITFFFRNNLYSNIAKPLLSQLPSSNNNLIATNITSTFLVPLKLSFLFTILISMPFILYKIWSFIAPALYKHERKIVTPLVIISCILFYTGVCFSFYIICPLALKFFIDCSPPGVTVMTDLAEYLDFLSTMIFSAGIAFQIPIITILLLRLNIITQQQLIEKRSYIIVLAFILGMILTPPDVVSQILLALPIWGLFELGILCNSIISRMN